jgi:hypothetical protein
MADHLSASCKCGSVEIRVAVFPTVSVNCHCQMCRKMNGAAFSTYVPVLTSDTSVSRGGDLIGSYPVTARASKHWCQTCGTPLFNTNSLYPGMSMLYLGALPEFNAIAPRANIFCSSKLAWVDTITHLTNYAEARTART